MTLQIASLNSGSNGNCYYIGNETDAILVDAGISCRETEKRLRRLSLDIQKLRAVFISHEHSDHINGLRVLAAKHRLPVYITPGTLQYSGLASVLPETRVFRPFEPVWAGSLSVVAFPKYHDARDPHSFLVEYKNCRVGVLTDIGKPCPNVIDHFGLCQAVFLEANYDRDMLMKGPYPFHLKKRISGGEGHLSNDEALQLFRSHRHPALSHLLLSHLSQNNNDPQRVLELFQPYAGDTRITVASRYQESPVFTINASDALSLPLPGRIPAFLKPQQLTLF